MVNAAAELGVAAGNVRLTYVPYVSHDPHVPYVRDRGRYRFGAVHAGPHPDHHGQRHQHMVLSNP